MFNGLARWFQDTVLTEKSRTIMTERFCERRGRGLCCAGRVDGAKAGEEDDDASASVDGGEGPIRMKSLRRTKMKPALYKISIVFRIPMYTF